MKITNRLGLPGPIVEAVSKGLREPSENRYSVTELIAPARQRALQRKHWNEIEQDASDMIYSLVGQIGHMVLEKAGDANIVETKIQMTWQGTTVSGIVDLISEETSRAIIDYKYVSVWVAKNGPKEEWTQQLNLYRLLAHENGIEVNRLQVVAIYRDWSKLEAARDSTYPQGQVDVFELPLWSLDQARAYLEERLRLHLAAKDKLPLCTPEERWAKPDTYAIVKDGQKRAIPGGIKISELVATKALKPGQHIEYRPGKSVRCENYCSVASFCSQYQGRKAS